MKKKQLVNVLTMIGFLSTIVLLTAVTSAQAQSLAYGVRANIPFDFTIGDKKLPAGKYSIGRVSPNLDDMVLAITGLDVGAKTVSLAIPVESREERTDARLVFHRYGDQYFLYQVWARDAVTGRQLIKSHSEREIERSLAGNSFSHEVEKNTTFETVTIVGG